jgi:hypothetical protein
MANLITSASHEAISSTGVTPLPVCRPELALLCTIAKVKLIPAEQRLLLDLLAGPIDWQYLLDLAEWHGLEPLLFHHLSRYAGGIVLPETIRGLRESCREIVWRNLILASKLQSVSAHLQSRRIEHISYKGPLFAQAYYGDPALRASYDLDILVPPSRFAAARDALIEIGFSDKYGFSAAQQAASFRWGFEHSFTAATGLELELHWHVVPGFISPSLDTAGIWERVTMVHLFDCEVPAFCPEDLLVVLCLHAGKHGWAHLSHFCDMAQLLLVHPQLDWDVVCSHLGDSNTARNVSMSLHLLDKHWRPGIPENIRARISADPHVARLAHRVQKEIWSSPRPVLTQSNLRWLLDRSAGEDLKDRLRFLTGVMFCPTTGDFEKFKLPQALVPFYPGLRVLRVACEYGSSWWQA